MTGSRKPTNEPEIRIIRPGEDPSNARMRMVEQLVQWLDTRFVIPGTKIRFGLDPILSLIPVLGDLVTYVISGALILTMYNQGASRKVVIKMVMNSTHDAIIGAIPLVGTFFDVFYRSNEKNLRLLREHYYEGKHQGSGTGLLLGLAFVSILLVAAAIYGVYKLGELIFGG